MAPRGRIALDAEQLRIAQATAAVAEHPEHLQIVGVHVDGVFLFNQSLEAANISHQIVDSLPFPDGSPMFHLKQEPACKVPT